jgi:16S rRNA (guanine966-N2)-methyltransferase
LRVVGGSARGKHLIMVPGEGTRPIVDRVKTSLFDMLRPRIDGTIVLDLFAGTGGVGIEALSQGAGSCTFIDLAPKAIATINTNLKTTGLADQAEVLRGDGLAYLRATERVFDLIYIAPPQYKDLWIAALEQLARRPEVLRAPATTADEESMPGLVVVQIDPREYESTDLGMIQEVRQKRYGNTLLVFYERSNEALRGLDRE